MASPTRNRWYLKNKERFSRLVLFSIPLTDSEKNTILFTLVYRGNEWPVQTRRNQYYSLMGLISDFLPISGFGICSGMGSCGTCAVKIDGMRCLSCDISVDDELANTRIVIDEAYF